MVVEFRNVSKTYKPGIPALRNVSFRIDDGEFVFIIGRSGSGKSTLIKLLTCEENPTGGKVFIDGYEVSFLKSSLIPYLRRNIGMVFQDFRLIQSKTVYQNVAFAMEIVGADSSLIRKRVPMVLGIVGLKDKANMKPGQLSGGEQQRVAIARAMVNNPKLILADEPTGNLDPINSESIMALLREINESGTMVIICSHDANMVNKLKRRVIEISEGRLVRDDASGEYTLSAITKPAMAHKRHSSQPKNGKKLFDLQDEEPQSIFVRNINLKFDELDLEQAAVSPDTTTAEGAIIDSFEDKITEIDSIENNSSDHTDNDEKTLQIVREYYSSRIKPKRVSGEHKNPEENK